ncbi:hypothetical protein EVAR_84503_1 [Eumeta japonica]|uniref:Mos1 transposase HTH domain-containing protein n=1 Tax=Eumeta variegata TaxID=151549 RepID=A0A4C1UHQ1_EUMVA|nr:hypothetical protein EVAR_84503_1 [Eumeta japonica]
MDTYNLPTDSGHTCVTGLAIRAYRNCCRYLQRAGFQLQTDTRFRRYSVRQYGVSGCRYAPLSFNKGGAASAPVTPSGAQRKFKYCTTWQHHRDISLIERLICVECEIICLEFRPKASEAGKEICKIRGEGTMNERTAQRWFNRFDSRDSTLIHHTRSGRPPVRDIEAAKEAVENPSVTKRL